MNLIKHLYVLLFLCIVFSSSGQETRNIYGFKAGANYSSFINTLDEDVDPGIRYSGKVGYFTGGFAKFYIFDKLRIQPELLFAHKKTGIAVDTAPVNDIYDEFQYKSTISESVFSIPVGLQIYLTRRFYLETGPQMSFLLERREKVKENPDGETGERDLRFDEIDGGLIIGTGIKFSESFGLSARYVLGLIEREDSIKSSVFSLGLEYWFQTAQ